MFWTTTLLILLLVILAWIFVRSRSAKIIIYEYERGLKYVNGKHEAVLEPGSHWIYRSTTSITRVDIRPSVLSVPGQEILTADSISLKVSLGASYQVVDPYLAINKTSSFMAALYLLLQSAAREIIGGRKIDELLEQRRSFAPELLALTAPKALELGIKLDSVEIKDIMFPGELKKVFAQVVKAQKEGLAALEKARGETASLRNLANAAKVLDNNPSLMQLRILQAVGESSGNTLVVGMPSGSVPLPVAAPAPVSRKSESTGESAKD